VELLGTEQCVIVAVDRFVKKQYVTDMYGVSMIPINMQLGEQQTSFFLYCMV